LVAIRAHLSDIQVDVALLYDFDLLYRPRAVLKPTFKYSLGIWIGRSVSESRWPQFTKQDADRVTDELAIEGLHGNSFIVSKLPSLHVSIRRQM
jgi:hypothetical protein